MNMQVYLPFHTYPPCFDISHPCVCLALASPAHTWHCSDRVPTHWRGYRQRAVCATSSSNPLTTACLQWWGWFGPPSRKPYIQELWCCKEFWHVHVEQASLQVSGVTECDWAVCGLGWHWQLQLPLPQGFGGPDSPSIWNAEQCTTRGWGSLCVFVPLYCMWRCMHMYTLVSNCWSVHLGYNVQCSLLQVHVHNVKLEVYIICQQQHTHIIM